MTKQQEQQLRLQAKARGYDKAKEDAYVEFIRNKIEARPQISQPEPPQKKAGDGFLKTLVKDPIKTLIVKPGVRAAQAGIALFGGERGKQFAEKDISVDLPVLGKFDIEAQRTGVSGAKQVAGDAFKSASYLFTPGKAAGAVKQGLAQKSLRTAFKGGFKTAAPGGAAYSGGEALIQDKPTKEVVKDTIVGGAVGGLAGGLLNTSVAAGAKGYQASKNLFKPAEGPKVSKAVSHLESKYEELFTGTKPARRTFTKSTQQGKTPARFLAEHGYIVDVEKGKINPQGVIEKINKNTEPLEEVLDDILKTKDQMTPETNRVTLDLLGRKAKQSLNTETNRASGYLQQQHKEIDRIIGELKASYGDTVTLSQLNAIKRGQWRQSKVFDATRPSYTSDIHATLGKEAKETIEEMIPEADIKALNRYLGDHYDAIKNLQRIDGNAVRGGRLGNYFGRTLGAVIGAKGGPLGSIAGAYGGDVVASIMQNYYLATPIKRMLLQRITQSNPAYSKAQAALSKLKAGQSMMRLPAPKPGSPKQSIHLPINQPTKIVPSDQPFKGKGALSR